MNCSPRCSVKRKRKNWDLFESLRTHALAFNACKSSLLYMCLYTRKYSLEATSVIQVDLKAFVETGHTCLSVSRASEVARANLRASEVQGVCPYALAHLDTQVQWVETHQLRVHRNSWGPSVKAAKEPGGDVETVSRTRRNSASFGGRPLRREK